MITLYNNTGILVESFVIDQLNQVPEIGSFVNLSIPSNLPYDVENWVVITNTIDSLNYSFEGVIHSYNIVTGEVTICIMNIIGSSTILELSQVNTNLAGIYESTGAFNINTLNAFSEYEITDYGNNITYTNFNRDLSAISVSESGQYQSASGGGDIYVSDDYGLTWAQRSEPPGHTYTCITMSATGQYQLAGSNLGVIQSSDYGLTWSIISGIPGQCWAASISSSGQYQTVAIHHQFIWTSNNFGVTWVQNVNAQSKRWTGVAVSSSGQYQSACSFAGHISVSSDFGNTWIVGSIYSGWYDIAISASGQYQTAVANNGKIYLSSNFGSTWNINSGSPTELWLTVSMSSTGKYQTAISGNFFNSGKVYVSSNFGNTWTLKNSSIVWRGASVSASGHYQSLVANSGIYRSISYIGTLITNIPSSQSVPYNHSSYQLEPNSNSQAPFIYISSNSAIASVSNTGLVSYNNIGNAIITISQNSVNNYTSASITMNVTVTKLPTNISVITPINKTYGNRPFNLNVTSNSQGIISYSSSNTNLATVTSDGLVTILQASSDSVEILIEQSETENYMSASTNAVIYIAKQSTIINCQSIIYAIYGSGSQVFPFPCTSNNPEPFVYTIIDFSNNVITLDSSNNIVILGVGQASYIITQEANINYESGEYNGVIQVTSPITNSSELISSISESTAKVFLIQNSISVDQTQVPLTSNTTKNLISNNFTNITLDSIV
jgi:hypothetical protein